ncbi:MAG: hypothetical protein KAS98_09150 [Deltaproteobacteria bacterium]|nr:hypothetical protein [Deltaproteobacteria bacterium]
MMKLKSALIACTVIFLLPFIIGCDPCMNNPCTDGLACNGLETCTADGGQAVCDDGTPVDCPAGQICREPDGDCVEGCATNEDCDDGDECTEDTCDDSTCVNDPIECPADEVCDPETGDCVPPECTTDEDCDDGDLCTEDACDEEGFCVNDDVDCGDDECDPDTGECVAPMPTTLLEAGGDYTGSGLCSDPDDRVTLTPDTSIVTLSGFSSNPPIPFTLTNPTTATASNVVAFGTPGHTGMLTLNPLTGWISFDLSVAGSCSTTLRPMQ